MKENKLRITWYGTASVRITARDSQLLIDPFFPFFDSAIKVSEDAFTGCEHILVSHGHFDHISSIGKIVGSDTIVYCTKTPYRSLCRKGIRKNNLQLIQAGDRFLINNFRITAYKGKHIKISASDCIKAVFCKRTFQNLKGIIRKLREVAACPEHKESLCYLIEIYGKRILVLGSLALADDIIYPTEVDLIFLPYQGVESSCKLDEIASEIYSKIRPKAVLLTHFDDTFPPLSTEVDTSEIEKYLKERATVYKLRHGDSFEI